MSFRLELLKLYLKHVVRRRLERYKTPDEMRRGLEKSAKRLPRPPEQVVFEPETLNVGDQSVEVEWCWWRDGGEGAPDSEDDRTVLYFHGGAFIAGSPKTHRSIAWSLARAADAAIASVDYRLAPEHPFPAALEDAVAAYDALLGKGVNPGAIVLAGDSAGGGLAFALAGEIDRSDRPQPAGVVGFSAFLDQTLSGGSLHRNARRETLLPIARIPEAVQQNLQGADAEDPRASPVFSTFQRPWRALLQVGSTEALRDDSIRMADVIRGAGGDVRLELWKGAPHVWQFFSPHIREARDAIDAAGAFIRTVTRDAERQAPKTSFVDKSTPLPSE
ncbi:MAG: alpha/beta hydrolase [Pseudomonadota bacterium]